MHRPALITQGFAGIVKIAKYKAAASSCRCEAVAQG